MIVVSTTANALEFKPEVTGASRTEEDLSYFLSRKKVRKKGLRNRNALGKHPPHMPFDFGDRVRAQVT